MALKEMKHCTDEELTSKCGKYTSKSTIRGNKNAHSVIVKYLEESGVENRLFTFPS